MLIGLSFEKKKGLNGSLKKIFGEIEDEMNKDFCNVKTLNKCERVLRFWEHTLK